MSQITLKPLDDGQSAFVIPIGKTTIGRGSLLGCSDKKVSRNHAVLEVTSKSEVFLTPTHVNPCFYQPSADSPGQILKKDVPHKLENGDSFSLLPRAYRYQLSIIDKEQNDLNKGKTNGSAGDSLEDLQKEPAKGVSSVEPTDTATPPEKLKSDSPPDIKKSPSPKDDPPKRPSPPRTDDSNPPKKKEKSPSPPSLQENNLPHSKEDKDSNDEEDEAKAEDNHLDKEDKKEGDEDKKMDEEEDKKDEDEEDKKEEKGVESCEESRDEGTLDTLPSKVSEGEEEGSKPPAKRGRKKAAAKPPKEEKISPVKRKAGGAPRGRKKKSLASRFDFGPGEEGNSSQRVAGRTSSRTNRQTRQGLSLEDFVVSDDDEWQSDHSGPKRRRKKKRGSSAAAARRNEDSGSDWEVDRKKPKKSIGAKGGSGSESGSDWGGSPKKKGAPKGRRRKGKVPAEEVASEEEVEEEEAVATSSAAPKQRIPCTHGKKCYRRNNNHVEQFSHPGDSDYASDGEGKGEGAPSVKKECPYGANCFRKNAQHKRDFKHTKKARPSRKASEDKKGKGSKGGDEVVDSYDLNDSLLNDESADEYKPVDSGSDYEHGERTKKLAARGKGARGGKRGRKA